MTGSNPDAAASDTAHRYTAQLAGEIESSWQQRWSETGVYEAPNPVGPLAGDLSAYSPDDKMFIQDMFPYPSGAGLHVGHPLGFIATDVFARFARMDGRNVLHTMGFDSFGLPAEQYAVQTGTHPRTTTDANIDRYLGQIRRLGLGHDERRRVATTDVEFYRWTQWIFLQIYNAWFDESLQRARPIAELIAEFDSGTRALDNGRSWAELASAEKRAVVDDHRLVYLSNSLVNWCPGLGTVLANEEVTAEGRSDIGNFPVFKRNMKQWMMRITSYSDRLLADLARRHLHVLLRDGIDDVVGRQVERREPGRVEPGAHRVVALAHERHVADAIEARARVERREAQREQLSVGEPRGSGGRGRRVVRECTDRRPLATRRAAHLHRRLAVRRVEPAAVVEAVAVRERHRAHRRRLRERDSLWCG